MRTLPTVARSSRSFPFALAALALWGCRIEKPATQVPLPPSVESFTASATEVARGANVTLSWTTANATSVELREATAGELGVPADSLTGTTEATINARSLFVLVARGPGGADARAVSVDLAGQGLGELSFQALPPVITGGGSTTLAWSAPGAASVTLTSGGQPVDLAGQRASGAVSVSPRFDATYVLTADGASKSVTVTVQPAVLTADLNPRAAESGDPVTVRWAAAGAESVVVSSPGRGQLFAATTPAQVASGTFVDTVPASPAGTVITYEIAAVKGSLRATQRVELNVGTGLAITRFVAPSVAAAGATYTVLWETRSADQVELKVDGLPVHQTGTAQTAAVGQFAFLAPAADFSVELVATNGRGGFASRTVQVDSSVGIPTSATLTADPLTVAAGQPVTLTFAAADARRVRITDSAGQAVFSISGAQAEAGTATVYPSVDTTFTLSADNLLGAPAVTASATVTVTGTPVTATQFPPTAISGQNVTISSQAGATLVGFPHEQVLTSPVAEFVDISSTAARVLEPGLNVVSVNLPFSTFLWGQGRSGPLTISRAGWMAWGAGLTVTTANAATLPSTTGAPGLIAPFWDDLTIPAGAGVYAQVMGEAPEQTLIVQWDKLQVGTDATSQVTFQAKVHQRGTVSFQYRTLRLAAGYTSFTIGLQDQTRQLAVRSAATPASNSAVYFFSPAISPVDVRVAKGSTWGGYVQVGAAWALVSRPATAYVIPTDLALTELMFRTHAAVPNGQYLEVLNRTGAALDLSGWELRAPNVPTFSLPANFVLQPGVPLVIGASADPAENDDAGVTLSWAASGFMLSQDAGSFTVGTTDAGASFTYAGAADGGRGVGINVDPGPFLGTTGSAGIQTCAATTPYGSQTPSQLGSPGSEAGCGFGYALQTIASRFVDISDGGTALINSPTTAVSSRTVPITLAATGTDPAPFGFGVRRPVVSMSVDGWMVWGSSTTTDSTNPTSNPSTSNTPVGKLAIFWDDLQTTPSVSPASELYWKSFAPNEDPNTPAQHWVFQWAHVRHASTSPADDLNFEVKLFTDGTIEYHFGAMSSGTSSNYADGNSATVWLENPASNTAYLLSNNQRLIRPNTAYRFVPR